MHSYAAAIDLNVGISDYWFWRKKTVPILIAIVCRNRSLTSSNVTASSGRQVVHYDTMHFEYRPELLGIGGKR